MYSGHKIMHPEKGPINKILEFIKIYESFLSIFKIYYNKMYSNFRKKKQKKKKEENNYF